MNKAIFLDRDGVINNDVGLYYIFKPEDFRLNEGILESLKLLQENGFLLIIISNQGGIAKKIYTKKQTDFIHNILVQILKEKNIKITEIYYCPHHNDIENCICRKPDSQMIEKAIARFQIQVNLSYFIGDSNRDIESAKKVKLNTFKIDSNQNILDICHQIIHKNK